MITSLSLSFEDKIFKKLFIKFTHSFKSLINFDLSNPVSLLNLISKIALAWVSVILKLLVSIKLSLSELIKSFIKLSDGIFQF